MDQLFGGLKSFIKPQAAIIDNQVYRLHYRYSFIILFAFSVMVTARQYFGDPIDCISKDDIPNDLLDTFCWIHTTFSVEEAWKKKVGVEVPYPGVDKYYKDETRKYHAYYQWVCFVLFFQAIFFYVPRYLWKAGEGGRTKSLILGLDSPIVSDEEKMKKRELIVGYLYNNRRNHNSSFWLYSFTEVINFVNVILQMFLMDRFLGGEFSSYGWKVLQFTEWDWSVRYDPMIKVFPRLTKCTFHRFGSSGDVQKHDAMCILPINIINEKIYVFLWFWFYLVAILSFVAIIYRALLIFSSKLRLHVTQSRCRVDNTNALRVVVENSPIGDWFVLDLLSKNLDPLNFRDLVSDYFKKLEGHKENI